MPETIVFKHFPLAAVVWPQRADGFSGKFRAVILIVLGTALLTLSAKVNLPLPYVPMTLQTLVVLMLGAAYGWRLGSATVIAYLVEGAVGLPVLAGSVGDHGTRLLDERWTRRFDGDARQDGAG